VPRSASHITRLVLVPIAALVCAIGAVVAAASQWNMQPRDSKLTFVGKQAGAEFEGTFERFVSDIRFDPQDLAGSHFDVRIDLASVNSRDSERDDTIRGPDLFAVKQFPTGHYVADKFSARGGNKYAATGKLTLRDVTRDVPIEFTFEKNASGAWLKGEATLQRLEFGVGQGEWKDTETVGNEVKVRFALLLKQ
jgi:polyisoprenoid-binding protein YceI